MAIRTIRAPGVEITEVDKSEYTPSMAGTTVLVAGFASKGESYEPTTITSKASLVNYFGEPKNEAERYFYAACNEVLSQNGQLIACKLPYDNESVDRFRVVKYTVKDGVEHLDEIKTDALIEAYIKAISENRTANDIFVKLSLEETDIIQNSTFIEALKEYVLSTKPNMSSIIKNKIMNSTSKIDLFNNILLALNVHPITVDSTENAGNIKCAQLVGKMPETANYFPGDIAGNVTALVSDGSTIDFVSDISGISDQFGYVIRPKTVTLNPSTGQYDEGNSIVAVKIDNPINDEVYVRDIIFSRGDKDPSTDTYPGSNVSAIYSMRGFTSINAINLPDSAQYVGNKAFANDPLLEHVSFGNDTKFIGSDIFKNSSNDPDSNGITIEFEDTCLSTFNTSTPKLSVHADTFSHYALDSINRNGDKGKVTGIKIYASETAVLSSVAKLEEYVDTLKINIRNYNPDIGEIKDYPFNKIKLLGKENAEMLRDVDVIEIVHPTISSEFETNIGIYEFNIAIDQRNSIRSYQEYADAILYRRNLAGSGSQLGTTYAVSSYFLYDIDCNGLLGVSDIEALFGFDFEKYCDDVKNIQHDDSIAELNTITVSDGTIKIVDKLVTGSIIDVLADLYKREDGEFYNAIISTTGQTAAITAVLQASDNIPYSSWMTGGVVPFSDSSESLSDTKKLVNALAKVLAKEFAFVRKQYIDANDLSLMSTRSITVKLVKGEKNKDYSNQPLDNTVTKNITSAVEGTLKDLHFDEIIGVFDDIRNKMQSIDPRTKYYDVIHALEDIKYEINNSLAYTHSIFAADNSVKKCKQIEYETNGTMPLQTLDAYLTGEQTPTMNNFIIVDKLGGQYAKTSSSKTECLGIIPVITTAANALYVQGLIDVGEQIGTKFNAVGKIVGADRDEIAEDELAIKCYEVDRGESSVSKMAARYFPAIPYIDATTFDHEDFRKVGVVVLRAYVDSGVSNKVNFEVLESFVGALNKDAVNPATGASEFIDRIVNSESEYIYMFSNVPAATVENTDILVASQQPAASLGWKADQLKKDISVSKSIFEGLEVVFQKNEDVHEKAIDIVVDAGISNIAQFIQTVYGSESQLGKGEYDPAGINSTQFTLRNNDSKATWLKVLQKFNEFCSKTRRDCMFVADGLRPICLRGSKKVVRPSKPTNTIDNSILPNLKYLAGINTNFGAGYMDWFEITDDFTGAAFWCPPSIKAAGCYIYTDVNYNYWDAPAGQKRGNITALDVAFSPSIKQAGEIYDRSWNYAINYADVGLILEGQKTLQQKKSAFDRVNVRRMFLRLERTVYYIARQFVYEPNTAFTRQCLADRLESVFSTVKANGGCYDYKIICDETINTPEVIDNNELRVKIGIKPTKTAEFILVQFYALRTNGSWDEMDIGYSM